MAGGGRGRAFNRLATAHRCPRIAGDRPREPPGVRVDRAGNRAGMQEQPPQQNGSDQPRAPGAAGAGRDPAQARRKTRKKRRRWLFHFSFWPMLGTVALGLFLVLASMAATGRVVPLPQWVAERIEARLNQELPSGSITLRGVRFGVSPTGAPRFALMDLSLKDGTGLDIARVYRVETGFRGRAALRGRFEPSQLSLSGAEVTLRRRVDGTFDLSFGQGGGASGDLAGVLDAIDEALGAAPLASVRTMSADALTITLEDARSGRIWQVTDGRLRLTQTDRIVDITVNFAVFNQTEELAEVVLGFRSDKASSEASVSASFTNAAAADIAAQSPLLAFLGVLDAPISGALRSSIDADGEVSELAGTLELGAGALSPTRGARPVRFETAKVYIDYDPGDDRLDFTAITARSELGSVSGQGYIYLSNFLNGWPNTLLGQFQVDGATIRAGALFAEEVEIARGATDFRLHLNPFTLELGQMVLVQEGTSFLISGEVAAATDGWSLALDGSVEQIGQAQAMRLWPLRLAPRARKWVGENVTEGELLGLNASIRVAPGEARRLAVEAGFDGFSARVVKAMPPLQDATGYMVINNDRFIAVSEGGFVPAPEGGKVEIAGSVFSVADMRIKQAPAELALRFSGPLRAVLSLLDGPPFRVLKNTDFGPDLATGLVSGTGQASFLLKPRLRPEDVAFEASAEVRQVRSDRLVPGKAVTAERLLVEVDNRRIEVSGAARIGKAAGSGSWFAGIGPAADGTSRLEATVRLNQAALDEFDIALPEGTITGEGSGQLTLDFEPGHSPAFALSSDLNRMGISIPEIGWSKPRNQTGKLLVEGHLDAPVSVDSLAFEAPGLAASGRVALRPDGSFERAEFDRVRLLGWLDAPVTLIGRGTERPVEIVVSGGTADMRRASFGENGGGGGAPGAAPVRIALDRLAVTEGITLTDFAADLDREAGLHGTFTARVNDGPNIRGVVAQQANGTAFRITSSDAGGVLKAAGVYGAAQGGDMTLILAPHAGEGIYDGELKISQVRSVGAPALLSLLGAISVIGLLEQIDREGILFQQVEARFRMTANEVIIEKSSAVGASLGISLDGSYRLGTGELDLAGVVSPIYLLNGLGQIFTRKGEGLLGFTYTLTGTTENPEVKVNPLSIFTPAMFRELFRKPPPKLEE